MVSNGAGCPFRENGIAERPQVLRYPENINNLSAIYAQSNAERSSNRPAMRLIRRAVLQERAQ